VEVKSLQSSLDPDTGKEEGQEMGAMKLANRSSLSIVFWIVVAVVSFSGSAAASPDVEIKTFYFDVGGETVREIRNTIRKHAVMQANRGHFKWVKSEWSTNWTVWFREAERGCVTTDVEARVTFEEHSPTWLNEGTATPETRARWRRTRAALDLYLRQSRESGIKAVMEIKSLYRRIGAFKSCEELKKAFHRTAKIISDLYQDRSRAIARRTGYGTRQFPDLREPIGVQTPVADSPDMEMEGWCQTADKIEAVEQTPCHFRRSCAGGTARCTIEFSWASERIRIRYEDGEPKSWNNDPAAYAFMNASPCVQNMSDKVIFCFSERRPDRVWFYHLP
jgi:predicted secreted Zn-dependent protease